MTSATGGFFPPARHGERAAWRRAQRAFLKSPESVRTTPAPRYLHPPNILIRLRSFPWHCRALARFSVSAYIHIISASVRKPASSLTLFAVSGFFGTRTAAADSIEPPGSKARLSARISPGRLSDLPRRIRLSGTGAPRSPKPFASGERFFEQPLGLRYFGAACPAPNPAFALASALPRCQARMPSDMSAFR